MMKTSNSPSILARNWLDELFLKICTLNKQLNFIRRSQILNDTFIAECQFLLLAFGFWSNHILKFVVLCVCGHFFYVHVEPCSTVSASYHAKQMANILFTLYPSIPAFCLLCGCDIMSELSLCDVTKQNVTALFFSFPSLFSSSFQTFFVSTSASLPLTHTHPHRAPAAESPLRLSGSLHFAPSIPQCV